MSRRILAEEPLRSTFTTKAQGLPPGKPTNLSGESQSNGEHLYLTWDAPEDGGEFLFYEVALDGVVIDTAQKEFLLYTGIVYATEYTFTVRCVGVFGIRGEYSDPFDWTGGGLQIMNPELLPGYRSATITWNKAQDNQDFTIDGYNVYYWNGASFIKQNTSLLPLTDTFYLKEDLGINEFVRMAVSFEYNSGAGESDLFEAQGITHPGPGGSYKATLKNGHIMYGVQRVVVIPETEFRGFVEPSNAYESGLFIEQGTRVLIAPLTDGNFNRYAAWGNSFNVYYWLSNKGRITYRFDSGCSNGISFVEDTMKDFRQALNQPVSVGFSNSASGFIVMGTACEGKTNENPEITFGVNFNPEAFLGRFKSQSGDRLHIVETPPPDNGFDVEVTGSDAEFTWEDYTELDGYNLYLNKDGAGYVKHNSELIIGSPYTAESLAVGSYQAFLTYIKEYPSGTYETTVEDLTTPVTFDIV